MLEEFLQKQINLLSKDVLDKIEEYLKSTAELRPHIEELAARLKQHDLIDELDTSPNRKADIIQIFLEANSAAELLNEATGIINATETICTLPTEE